jgi:hypothetical protein
LEWLNNHNHGDAGVMFSNKKKKKQQSKAIVIVIGKPVVCLNINSMHSLKRVARLLGKDQKTVLKFLKQVLESRE